MSERYAAEHVVYAHRAGRQRHADRRVRRRVEHWLPDPWGRRPGGRRPLVHPDLEAAPRGKDGGDVGPRRSWRLRPIAPARVGGRTVALGVAGRGGHGSRDVDTSRLADIPVPRDLTGAAHRSAARPRARRVSGLNDAPDAPGEHRCPASVEAAWEAAVERARAMMDMTKGLQPTEWSATVNRPPARCAGHDHANSRPVSRSGLTSTRSK